MNGNILIDARNITKKYTRGNEDVLALNNVSISISKGEYVSFVGPSGSGKTTLVNILGCLDNPTEGKLFIGGKPVFEENRVLSESNLTLIRRQYFGYIFQSFYLIPTLTVYENVLLPSIFYKKEAAGADVTGILKELGIEQRAGHFPRQLSGGEMQRAAIARALVNKPRVLFADEPTGNLDAKRTDEIGRLLLGLNKNNGITIIMVTHNNQLAEMSGRIIKLRDGAIQS